MSTQDCIRLARILAFVQRHDHPEAELDHDAECVRWENLVGDSDGTWSTEPCEASTMTEARELLGY